MDQATAAMRVDAVLRSASWREVLGFVMPGGGGGEGDGAAETPIGRDLEAGLTQGQAVEDLPSDVALLEAFLRIGVEVHPFRNPHAQAPLALRWTAVAYERLRGQREPQRGRRSEDATSSLAASHGNDEEPAAHQLSAQAATAPLGEQVCPMSDDEAQRLFAEVVSSTSNRLSLRNPETSGLSKASCDALLRSLHLLHLGRPENNTQDHQRALDSLLSSLLAVHWLLVSVAQLISSAPRRQWTISTSVAALGGVAFSSATRIHRVLTADGESLRQLDDVGSLEPLVHCPLCRKATPACRAIQDVHAGDAVPTCCICTENPSNVCLRCGHLCLCMECFQQLPRTTTASLD